MKKEIESIGTFNAQKKKETLQELFSKWYPQINAFENQLRPYDNRIKDLEHDHVVMKHDYDRKDLQASRANDEAANLRSQLWEYQDFMESIQEELREELLRKYQQGQGEQEQGQEYTL
ncbi:MAG: hypothetical protein RR423_02930 [Hydrogenoanaerobacterium sp.]